MLSALPARHRANPSALAISKRLGGDVGPAENRGADPRISGGQTHGNPYPLKDRFLEQSEEQSSGAIGSAGTVPETKTTQGDKASV